MTTVTNEISKFEVGKIYLTDSDVANGTTDSKTKVISREGDLVKFQHLASGAEFEQIAFELGAGEVCEGYPQRGENIHETLSASNSFEVENEMTTEINEDTVKMNAAEVTTESVNAAYPSWYEVKAVILSIAEKHGFEVNLMDSCGWIKSVGNDSIEVKCRDSFVSSEITKYSFEYHSSSTHTFKTTSEVTDFANAVNQLKNFAEEIESRNLNNVFCREGGDKSNGWILENGDARAFQFYIELIQRKIAWTERYLNDELTKYLPENKAKMEEAERELTSLQNSRKKGKKIDRRITELSRDIKSLKERIADSPVRVLQYQDKIAVLQEEIQQGKKWVNPDELPELSTFQVTENAVEEIDASDYVISVDAQDVAINAEIANAQAEVVAVNSENANITEEVPAEPEEKIYSLAEVKAILEQKITEYGFKVKYSGFGLTSDQFFDPKEPENHLPNTDKICGFGHSYRDGESWHCAFITTLTEFVAENIFKVRVECGIPSMFGDHLTPAEMLKAAEEITRAAHLAEVIQSLNLNFRFEYDAEKKQVA